MGFCGISIHAPSRERRSACNSAGVFSFYFNPRSLAGATQAYRKRVYMGHISIHAPSRERRYPAHHTSFGSCHFNPRSLAGATIILGIHTNNSINFNPRSLAGATSILSTLTVYSIFQSTLPRGSDSRQNAKLQAEIISIHAPSRERHLSIVKQA